MAGAYLEPTGLYRFGEALFRRTDRLKEDFFSSNDLLEDEAGRVWVLKTSRILYARRMGRGLARWLSRREQAFYRRLAGIEGVPALHPATGPNFLLHEFVPGATLKVRREVDDRFFDRLAALVRAIHERGVASVDLSKKANIIVGDDGRPYLIDFQIAMGLVPPVGPLARLVNAATRHLMREDLYHVYKHKLRVRPDLLRDWERELATRRSPANRLHGALLRRPYLALKRRIFPAGSHELSLFRRRENRYPGG